MKMKKKAILAIPIALSLNTAILLYYAEIETLDYTANAPLPGFTEMFFSVPFILWIVLGLVFSYIKYQLDQKPEKKKLKFLWWFLLISSPFILALAIACPFSHELSHYFTGTCNWDW